MESCGANFVPDRQAITEKLVAQGDEFVTGENASSLVDVKASNQRLSVIDVFKAHPGGSGVADADFEIEYDDVNWDEFKSTDAIPGSKAKLAVLADRVRRGLPLWHPDDRREADETSQHHDVARDELRTKLSRSRPRGNKFAAQKK